MNASPRRTTKSDFLEYTYEDSARQYGLQSRADVILVDDDGNNKLSVEGKGFTVVQHPTNVYTRGDKRFTGAKVFETLERLLFPAEHAVESGDEDGDDTPAAAGPSTAHACSPGM